MATFGDLKAEISDDIDDPNNEYGSQIASAVLAAIRYCERTQFYFNETREKTFNTVIGQQWYDKDDLADIATLIRIQRAYVTVNGDTTDLLLISPDEIEVLSDNTAATGEPYGYCVFGQRLRLYPIPNGAYQVRLQLAPYRLAMPVADGDQTVWTTEAYDMIKARAKYILAKNTLKDAAIAAEALNDYQDQFQALKAETSSRLGTGRILPTSF